VTGKSTDRTNSTRPADVGCGVPRSVDIPNAETQEAMRQALEDEDLQVWSDLEALKCAQG
jgi:hypothetical protein